MSKSQRTVLVMLTVAALIAVAVAAVAAAPVPAPASQPQQAATPAPTAGDWQKIKAAGKIIVGTSADYPPFEFYDKNFKMDGFDIALMQEIGKQLGLKVQFRDMAFDGLGNALQLGQIDAAMAAISITADREAVVDFSDVYYVGEDAVLAKKDSRITKITSVENVVDQRIGVQKASVYETWLRDNLLDTGQMQPEDLMLYTDISGAVRDLKAGRIDLVALDALQRAEFVLEGGVKIVEQGKSARHTPSLCRLAPARRSRNSSIPRSANCRIRALWRSWCRSISSSIPMRSCRCRPPLSQPTPAPTPTAEPEACTDGTSYVADLNYDDKSMTAPPVMQPWPAFTKGWRLRNSGTCIWDQTYTFAYSSGNSPLAQMGGQPVRVSGTVAPGATYDFKVPLTAPTQPGTYQAFSDHGGLARHAVRRSRVGRHPVAGPPTPVPQPTAPPHPASLSGPTLTTSRRASAPPSTGTCRT